MGFVPAIKRGKGLQGDPPDTSASTSQGLLSVDSLSWEYLRYCSGTIGFWGINPSVDFSSQLFPHLGWLSASFPIYILVLKPLAIVLRDDPNISGIPYACTHHKVSLFADDVLLTLTNPLTTLSNPQAHLSHFSAFSGFHVNPHKTTAEYFLTPLNGDPTTSLLSISLELLLPGIPWCQVDPSVLIPLYHQLLSLTTIDYIYNARFPSLSWADRIYAVKMSILYQKSLLFSYPPSACSLFFALTAEQELSFIWAYKCPPPPFTDTDSGGLSLVRYPKYCQAAQISQLILLHATLNIPLWVLLVPQLCPNSSYSLAVDSS